MRPGALIAGIIVSVVLLAAAGGLYTMGSNHSGQHYRTSIDLIRQIQELSASWSIEIARVRSDPLADFDALAAIIPRMARLKTGLADTVRRDIPDIPDRLASDIQAYLSLVDAKEERIERFKTGYAVVRNSTRYLPLAAANVMRQAQEANDQSLARSVSILAQNMNRYLATPSDAGKDLLSASVRRLREESVAYPTPLANAIANLLAHAEVLLERQVPTDELFHEATTNETAGLANRLTGNLEFEIARHDSRAANYERGVLAVIAVLAMFWILLAIQQRASARAAETPATPRALEADLEEDAALPGMAPSRRAPAVHGGAIDTARGAAFAPPTALSAESAMRYEFLAERVGDSVVATAERVVARIEKLRQVNRTIRHVLQRSDVVMELPDGIDLDAEVEASGALTDHMYREVNGIAGLAKRLASLSGLPNGDPERDMVDINACIDEVVAATGADRAAEVTKRLGDVPEIFASRTEVRLLLTQILENSMRAVEGLKDRAATIKVDTVGRNEVVVITIRDNGPGIAPEQRGQIFRPFYTSRDGAMGLGLTLAGSLVKKYEGGIKVNSLPGQGTVTQISLPSGTRAP